MKAKIQTLSICLLALGLTFNALAGIKDIKSDVAALKGQSLDKTSEIFESLVAESQKLQAEKEDAIQARSGTPSGYSQWVQMKMAREGSFFGMLGVSVESRAEQEARANIPSPFGAVRKSLQDYDNELHVNLQKIEVQLQYARETFPEHSLQLLDIQKKIYEMEKQMAASESRAVAQSYRMPYPNARAQYNAENERMWPSSQRLAMYHGQINDNNDVGYARLSREKEISRRVAYADEQLVKLEKLKNEISKSGSGAGVKVTCNAVYR